MLKEKSKGKNNKSPKKLVKAVRRENVKAP